MKQSYVPPHKRNQISEKDNQKNQLYNKKSTTTEKKIEKREKKLDVNDLNQFPDLEKNNEKNNERNNEKNKNNEIKNNEGNNKPSLSSIFKQSLLNKKKPKKQKLKKGWIHLTKNGIIDSLTPEERKEEDDQYEQRIMKINLQRMCVENERKLQYRRDNDHTYLWEELRIIDEYEENETDEDSEYDSYDDLSQTEDDFYELNNKEMW